MAYRAWLRQIAARLRAHLRRRMPGVPDDVEDLVQETLLALHTQRGADEPTLPVSAWVCAIARHKLVDLWRRRGRHDALHEALDDVDESLLAADAREGAAHRDLAQFALLARGAGLAPRAVAARRLAPAAARLTAGLARPVARLALPRRAVFAVFAAMAALGLATRGAAAPDERLPTLLGRAWRTRADSVLALSLPALAGLLWALRGLAPPRPVAAGFAAGLGGALLGPRVLRR